MFKKWIKYFLIFSLANPGMPLIAGGVCCKQKQKDALEILVTQFRDSIISCNKWKSCDNMIYVSRFQRALEHCYDLLEYYKKLDNNPEKFIADLSTPENKVFFSLYQDFYNAGGRMIWCGSVEEMIYKLFTFERPHNAKKMRELLVKVVGRSPANEAENVSYQEFLKNRAHDAKLALQELKNDAEYIAPAPQKGEELTFMDHLFGRTVQSKRTAKLEMLALALRTSINACDATKRYKQTDKKALFDRCLKDAYKQCFNIMQTVKDIDPKGWQLFFDALKEGQSKAKAINGVVPLKLYSLFESVFKASQDVTKLRSTDELFATLATIDPKYISEKKKKLEDELAIVVGFRCTKNEQMNQALAMKEFFEKNGKAQSESAAAVDPKTAEEEKAKKEREQELKKELEERLKKQALEVQKAAQLKQDADRAALEKAEQERAAAAKASADKLELEKKQKTEKAERRKQRIIDEQDALKEIEAKRLKESQKALADLARAQADQAKKEQEEREALLLEEQKRAAEKLDKIKKAAAKEAQLAELEETWKSQHDEKIKRKAITQWQHAARHVEKAMENAQALCEKNIKKHAVHAWLDAMKQQKSEQRAIAFNIMQTKKRTLQTLKKLIDQKKELEKEELAKKAALEKVEADLKTQALQSAQENEKARALLDQKTQHEKGQSIFKAHMQLKMPVQNITPLTDAINAQASQTMDYSQWCSDHIDSEIYLAAYNYLFNKSSFKSSKPKIKLACQLCDAHINKQVLENGIKDLHWSSFTRDREYQDAALQVKCEALKSRFALIDLEEKQRKGMNINAKAFALAQQPKKNEN